MQGVAHADFAFEEVISQPLVELQKLAERLDLLEKVHPCLAWLLGITSVCSSCPAWPASCQIQANSNCQMHHLRKSICDLCLHSLMLHLTTIWAARAASISLVESLTSSCNLPAEEYAAILTFQSSTPDLVPAVQPEDNAPGQ